MKIKFMAFYDSLLERVDLIQRGAMQYLMKGIVEYKTEISRKLLNSWWKDVNFFKNSFSKDMEKLLIGQKID